MSFQYIQQLPTPAEILEELPVGTGHAALKRERDAEIARVFRGEADKFLVIV